MSLMGNPDDFANSAILLVAQRSIVWTGNAVSVDKMVLLASS